LDDDLSEEDGILNEINEAEDDVMGAAA